MHTSRSLDAWIMGNRLTGPDEAFKYTRGQALKHPMGFDIRISTLLDFMGVTEHAERVGVDVDGAIPLQRVGDSYRLSLNHHSETAGGVVADLASWPCWDFVPDFLALPKPGVSQQYPSRMGILDFLCRGPHAGALEITLDGLPSGGKGLP